MTAIASTISRYEYFSIDFRVTQRVLHLSLIDSDDLRVLISKVVCYSVLFFMTLVAFEATFVNGTRLLLNAVICILNFNNWLFFGSGELPDVSAIPLLPRLAPPPQQVHEPLPPLTHEEKEKFRDIVETLGTASYLSLAFQGLRLRQHQKETSHLHPLQSLAYMLEKGSPQKEFVALMFRRTIVRDTFVNDTLESFVDPVHAAKTENYIPAFAEKVGVSLDAVRSFLQQNPIKLQDLIVFILQSDDRHGKQKFQV